MKRKEFFVIPTVTTTAILYIVQALATMSVDHTFHHLLASCGQLQVVSVETDHKPELGLEPCEVPPVSLANHKLLSKAIQTPRFICRHSLEHRVRIRTRPNASSYESQYRLQSTSR